MQEVSQSTGKEIWQKFADSDGWISKSVIQITDEMDYGTRDEKEITEESLSLAQNYFDIEFENEKEERWRFKD